MNIQDIIDAYELPEEFPPKVQQMACRCPQEVIPNDFDGRMDLRDWQMVTIDGEDARDLDDAVSLTMDGGSYLLGVHIADVSNYVQAGSALDREALKRGTSVYLPDRVIPMLPRELSNGICSLNQGEDRLALSCLMRIDGEGRVTGHKIAETVIHVDRRMTYTAVNRILTEPENCPELMEEYRELVPMFRRMAGLSARLRERRAERGAIEFEFPESKIILDEEGTPVDIRPHESNTATRLIEDFMLIANETVAREYCTRKIPFLYRTHEKPDREKMEGALQLIPGSGNSGQQKRTGYHPGGGSENSSGSVRDREGAAGQPAAASVHVKSRLYDGLCRTFRSRCRILLPFYVADPEVSGSPDSPDHQGRSEGQTGPGRKTCRVQTAAARSGGAFQFHRAESSGSGAGGSEAEKSGVYAGTSG